jgi:uncharacterized protein
MAGEESLPPRASPASPARPPTQALAADPTQSPITGWPWWSAFAALLGAFVLTALGSLIVDLPAIALGANLTSSHTPAGLVIADTFVQDLAFVAAPLYCAHVFSRTVQAWQFGLRPPGVGWRSAVRMIVLLLVVFILLNAAWAALLHPPKEKLLKQLGSEESGLLLVLSAGLTCVVAPICEEFLFRGYIFTALRAWGTLPAALVTALLFGGVHVSSAPVADLLPLAALGFGLCMLYRYTGSLYPGIATHSLNNSIAFASLEGWGWQAPVLVVSALAGIWLVVLACKRAGWIPSGTGIPRPAA